MSDAQTYSADQFRLLAFAIDLESDHETETSFTSDSILIVAAALRIAARVMEPGFIESALAIPEHEALYANNVRSALTKEKE